MQVVGCLTLYLIFLHGIKMKIFDYPCSDYRLNPPWCTIRYTCLLRDWQPWTEAMYSSLPTCLANSNNHGTTASVCTTTSARWVSAPRHICHTPHISVWESSQCQTSASSFSQEGLTEKQNLSGRTQCAKIWHNYFFPGDRLVSSLSYLFLSLYGQTNLFVACYPTVAQNHITQKEKINHFEVFQSKNT